MAEITETSKKHWHRSHRFRATIDDYPLALSHADFSLQRSAEGFRDTKASVILKRCVTTDTLLRDQFRYSDGHADAPAIASIPKLQLLTFGPGSDVYFTLKNAWAESYWLEDSKTHALRALARKVHVDEDSEEGDEKLEAYGLPMLPEDAIRAAPGMNALSSGTLLECALFQSWTFFMTNTPR